MRSLLLLCIILSPAAWAVYDWEEVIVDQAITGNRDAVETSDGSDVIEIDDLRLAKVGRRMGSTVNTSATKTSPSRTRFRRPRQRTPSKKPTSNNQTLPPTKLLNPPRLPTKQPTINATPLPSISKPTLQTTRHPTLGPTQKPAQVGFTLYGIGNEAALDFFPTGYNELRDLFDLFYIDLKLIPRFSSSSSVIKSVQFIVRRKSDPMFSLKWVVSTSPYAIEASFLKTPGDFAIRATAYSSKADGTAPGGYLENLDISLSVSQPFRYTLVDVNTGTDITTLSTRMRSQIDLNQYAFNASFDIRVETIGGPVSCMQFELNPSVHVPMYYTSLDTKAPFTLGGDSTSNHYYKAVQALVDPGSHSLTVIASKGVNTDGAVISSDYIFFDVLPRLPFHSFTLVDVTNKADLTTDYSYIWFDLSMYPSNTTFTIRANSRGNVGSVAFNITSPDGTNYTKVDNVAPFSLDADPMPGKYYGVPALQVPGEYIVDVTAFTGPNQGGEAGHPQRLYIKIYPKRKLTVLAASVVDATTGKDISGDTIYLLDYPANAAFTVRVQTSSDVGSVEFKCTDRALLTVDNTPPFTLDGNSVPGNYSGVPELSVAGYPFSIIATAYAGRDMNGEAGLSTSFWLSIHGASQKYKVYNFSLIDTTIGYAIEPKYPVMPGMPDPCFLIFDLKEYPSSSAFTIRANTSPDVSFVDFSWSEFTQASSTTVVKARTVDKVAPFSVDGDSSPGNYKAFPYLSAFGYYVLDATPYGGQGTPGLTTTCSIKLLPAQIRSVTLVDVLTGRDLEDFIDTDVTIDLNKYNTITEFSVRVNILPTVGSVEFNVTQDAVVNSTVVDSVAPFSLDGASTPGKYKAIPLLSFPGHNYYDAQAYVGPNKQGGKTGEKFVVTVQVLPMVRITGLVLVELTTGEALIDHYMVNLATYQPNASFTVIANTIGQIGSVVFNLMYNDNGIEKYTTIVDSVAPFSLDGNSIKGGYAKVPVLTELLTSYYLQATPFTGSDGDGVAGTSATGFFQVTFK